jgi:hypothetical protein
MKNWAVSLMAFATIIFLGWYGGTNYLMRGGDQALWVAEALGGAACMYFYCRLKMGPHSSRLSLGTTRKLWTLAVFSVVLADGWYAGVRLDVRGGGPAGLLVLAMMCAGLTWFCPVWTPIELGPSRRR